MKLKTPINADGQKLNHKRYHDTFLKKVQPLSPQKIRLHAVAQIPWLMFQPCPGLPHHDVPSCVAVSSSFIIA